MEVIRTFHPIGQGAFYSERFVENNHDKVFVVYDCGSNNKTTLVKHIRGCFPKGAEIDILFVSHFHADHVNGIATLRNNYKIKKVVLPLVEEADRMVLKIYNFASGGKRAYQATRQIIDDPQSFFKKNQKSEPDIIYVKPTGDSRGEFSRGDNHTPADSLKDGKDIDSYQGITIFDWIYIPFNYKEEERITQFKEHLSKEGINVKDCNDELFADKEKVRKIKKAYDRLDGRLNGNSLMVYSGTLDHEIESYSISRLVAPPCFPFQTGLYIDKLHGCLYLGDADLNDPEMLKTINNTLFPYTGKVGLIQIPHHGSGENYNPKLLDIYKKVVCYVLSYGQKNQYGHPSHYVLSSIACADKYLVLVNEEPGSMFVQKILCK